MEKALLVESDAILASTIRRTIVARAADLFALALAPRGPQTVVFLLPFSFCSICKQWRCAAEEQEQVAAVGMAGRNMGDKQRQEEDVGSLDAWVADRVDWRVVDSGKLGVDADGPTQISSELIHEVVQINIHSGDSQAVDADMAGLGVVPPIVLVVGRVEVQGDTVPVD